MSDANRRVNSGIQVKICGITNEEDALAALDCGADALGFNVFPGSKRYLDIQLAKKWMARLPTEAPKVAVLVNPTLSDALQLAELDFIDSLQLHGMESPAFCQSLAEAGVRFTKAVPITTGKALIGYEHFFTRSVLLDSSSARGFGGTGETLPWPVARAFIEDHPALEVTLAGGLTPENVADAIHQVEPFGLDVTTGVESSPGRKDRDRLRAFLSAVRRS
jgi:phosphoribosylanthranilate isomerase